MVGGLHAGHPFGADRGTVDRARRQVEPITRAQQYVAIGGVERDCALDAEENLVIGVLVVLVDVSGTVRPGVRCQVFG